MGTAAGAENLRVGSDLAGPNLTILLRIEPVFDQSCSDEPGSSLHVSLFGSLHVPRTVGHLRRPQLQKKPPIDTYQVPGRHNRGYIEVLYTRNNDSLAGVGARGLWCFVGDVCVMQRPLAPTQPLRDTRPAAVSNSTFIIVMILHCGRSTGVPRS